MKKTIAIAKKLTAVSEKIYPIPSQRIDWEDTVATDQWFTSPELISLYGTSEFDQLTESQQKVLSFWDAVNYYSLNINGEIPLVKGLTDRLFVQGNENIVSYLHHFIDEENKHMQYFGRFCQGYAGKVYPDKKIVFPRDYVEGEEEFLFFLKVLIFEEISDYYNIAQSKDERLHPIARSINLLHHQDEARHLIFGRQIVKELFDLYRPTWSEEVLSNLRGYIQHYITATWREYYNPEVYRDAGLDKLGIGSPYELYQCAYNSATAKKTRETVSKKFVSYLLETEILIEEPQL